MSQLVENQNIAPQDIDQAMFISKSYPAHTAWVSFVSKLLLWFGALALTWAVIFFV